MYISPPRFGLTNLFKVIFLAQHCKISKGLFVFASAPAPQKGEINLFFLNPRSGLGGASTKTHWVILGLDTMRILEGVKPLIYPPGLWYTKCPHKMGGLSGVYRACRPLWL